MNQTDRPTLLEMLSEVANLSAGLGVALLPLFVLAVPSVIAFVLLPALLLLAVAAPLAALAAIAAAPVLLVRSLRRGRG